MPGDVRNFRLPELKLFRSIVDGNTVGDEKPGPVGPWVKAPKMNSAFYTVTRFVILTLCYIGRFPYQMKEGKLFIQPTSIWSIASFVMYFCQSCLTYYIIPDLVSAILTESFDNAIFSTIVCLLLIFYLFLPFTAWNEWPALCSYYNQWADFEIHLQRSTGIELKRRMGRLLMVIGTMEIIVMGALFLIQASITSIRSLPIVLLIFALLYIDLHMYIYIWVFGCVFVSRASDNLLEYTLKVVLNNSASAISSCRLLWLKISELTSSLADTLAPSLLLSFLATGVIFIISSYALLVSIKRGEFSNFTLPFFSFFAISCSTVFSMCDSAHRTTFRVGNRFSSQLLKINTINMDISTRKEFTYLINTVASNKPVLMFAGFFTINRNLFVSFMSSTVTYLIVLIQFNTSEGDLMGVTNSSTSNVVLK